MVTVFLLFNYMYVPGTAFSGGGAAGNVSTYVFLFGSTIVLMETAQAA